MSDNRLWCPTCKETHYRPTHTDDPDSCNGCETRLDETIPLRVRTHERIGQAVALIILAAVALGPPAYAVVRALSGGPLVATRTVTTTHTQPYGILPEVVPMLFVWGLLLFVGWGAVTGRMPAPSGGF